MSPTAPQKTRLILAFLMITSFALFAHAEWIKQETNSFTWFHDVYFLDHKKGWIVGSDGAMLATEDGGNTWAERKKFTADTLLQVHFENESTGWLLCLRNVYARGDNPTSY